VSGQDAGVSGRPYIDLADDGDGALGERTHLMRHAAEQRQTADKVLAFGGGF